jgi:hypothetical protein
MSSSQKEVSVNLSMSECLMILAEIDARHSNDEKWLSIRSAISSAIDDEYSLEDIAADSGFEDVSDFMDYLKDKD